MGAYGYYDGTCCICICALICLEGLMIEMGTRNGGYITEERRSTVFIYLYSNVSALSLSSAYGFIYS